MKLRAVLLLFASILAVVTGLQTCLCPQKCLPLEDCSEYTEYAGTPNKFWPTHVREKAKGSLCYRQQRETKMIYKFCCNKKTVTRTDNLNTSSCSGKSGCDLLDLEICGRVSKDRIAHGRIAAVFAYPWMALLGNQERQFHCGGSLIAESFVLTAAHCNRNLLEIVRVGETDLSKPIDCNVVDDETDCAKPHQDIEVAKFIKHSYSISKKKNDIALVKLSQPAQLSFSVRPICLPIQEMLPKKIPSNMEVSGWGFTEDKRATSSVLRWAQVPIVEQNQCQLSLCNRSDVYTVDESQVCAGAGEDGADNCEGDSGGPLQYFGKTGYVVHGVVSYGLKECGKDKAPGVYTKVAHYLDWIIDNLK